MSFLSTGSVYQLPIPSHSSLVCSSMALARCLASRTSIFYSPNVEAESRLLALRPALIEKSKKRNRRRAERSRSSRNGGVKLTALRDPSGEARRSQKHSGYITGTPPSSASFKIRNISRTNPPPSGGSPQPQVATAARTIQSFFGWPKCLGWERQGRVYWRPTPLWEQDAPMCPPAPSALPKPETRVWAMSREGGNFHFARQPGR